MQVLETVALYENLQLEVAPEPFALRLVSEHEQFRRVCHNRWQACDPFRLCCLTGLVHAEPVHPEARTPNSASEVLPKEDKKEHQNWEVQEVDGHIGTNQHEAFGNHHRCQHCLCRDTEVQKVARGQVLFPSAGRPGMADENIHIPDRGGALKVHDAPCVEDLPEA